MTFGRKSMLATAAVVLALAVSSCSADGKPEASTFPTTVESSAPEATPEPTMPATTPTSEPTPEPEATLSSAEETVMRKYEEQKKVDKKFVKDMSKFPQLNEVRDKVIVAFAYFTCENLDNGLNFVESVEAIQNEKTMDDFYAGVLVDASIVAYCPQHTEMLQNEVEKAGV